MIKIKDIIGFPSLNYHLENGLSLSENVYRYSSERFIQLFAEARNAWRDGLIELNEEDTQLLESTDIGEYGLFEGEKVPLDLPMLEEEPQERYYSDEKAPTEDDELDAHIYNPTGPNGENEKWSVYKNIKTGEYNSLHRTFREPPRPTNYATDETKPKEYERLHGYSFEPNSEGETEKWAVYWDPKTNTFNTRHRSNNSLNEAEFKGKDVALNKPKRGGPKKFFVYVKNPKTGNVKKVNFGDSGNLSVKINEPGARASFAARHQCDKKKDKTKPGYWSCNIGRYWKSLGGSKNFSGYW
jgi:hypothetical protein